MERGRLVGFCFDVVSRRRWFILGVLISAVVVAALLAYAGPRSAPAYEATALLLVSRPDSQVNFDPRFQQDPSLLSYKAYGVLIKSPDVEQKVLAKLGPAVPAPDRSPQALDEMARISQKDDPSVIQLTVRANSAEEAALIANTWADVFQDDMSNLQGSNGRDPQILQQQLAQADSELQKANDALAEFYKTSPLAELQTRQPVVQKLMSAKLAAKSNVNSLIQSAGRLKAQLLSSGSPTSPLSLSDATSLYVLEARAADPEGQVGAISGASAGPGSSNGWQGVAPMQLEVPVGQLSQQNLTIGQAVDRIDRLVTTLNSAASQLEADAAQQLPELNRLTQQLAQEKAKEDRLVLDRDTAKQTYTTIKNKIDESRVAADVGTNQVRVVSHAQPGVEVGNNGTPLALAVILAAVLGAIIGVVGAFGIEFFDLGRRTMKRVPAAEPSD